MIDQIVFKDVWEANDAKAERDAIAAWQAAGDRLGNLTDEQRSKILCVVAYNGDHLCAAVTCQVRYMAPVRENMAWLQIFVARNFRGHKIGLRLNLAGHAAMSRYALANPQLRIGGIAGRALVRNMMPGPVTLTHMTLVGYSERNEPLLVRWFDHFQYDEEGARARDPRKAQQLQPN